MTNKKIKVFIIADHPFAPSGVGTQTRYVIDTLIKTGKYKFICFGGAVEHKDYTPQQIKGYEEDWVVIPVKGYGTPDAVRSILVNERPDILWFMTDPRFYEWLWQMENEIRPHLPMVYYHVWDNYPYPTFNKKYYESTDVIASISKVTYDIVNTVSPDVENHYVPHAVDTTIFKPMPREEINIRKKEHFGEDQKFTFIWNNRNARRKMSSSLMYWFNDFAEEVGPDKVRLIMHTEPKDPNGPDLISILKNLKADDGRIVFSTQKVPPEALAIMYNISDCTINISDAEGFGLGTLESLACGVPIIANMTGGLQEQVTNGKEWFGIGINPASKAIIGSQQVPYIYEDRISKEDFIAALKKMYSMSLEDRTEMGQKGRQHVLMNYNFENFKTTWIKLMDNIHKKYGSWETRQGYTPWVLKEIK